MSAARATVRRELLWFSGTTVSAQTNRVTFRRRFRDDDSPSTQTPPATQDGKHALPAEVAVAASRLREAGSADRWLRCCGLPADTRPYLRCLWTPAQAAAGSMLTILYVR